MKKYLFILLIMCNYTFSQNTFSNKIKIDCEIMISALKNNNYNKILDYTYPKIVEMGGGREKLSSIMKSSFDKMKSEGYTFENQIIEEPQNVFIAGKELHCVIPKNTIMKTPKGRIKATYYYLGISKNGGDKWFFIETHMLNDENIKLIFPNFNYDLKIPKNTKPILID